MIIARKGRFDLVKTDDGYNIMELLRESPHYYNVIAIYRDGMLTEVSGNSLLNAIDDMKDAYDLRFLGKIGSLIMESDKLTLNE